MLSGLIDLHAHLLPGVDDGPPDAGATLAIARAAVSAGTRTMVATPHIDHEFNLAPREIASRLDEVRALLAAEDVPLEALPGGELALSRAFDLEKDELEAIRLGGGPYLLLECPFTPAADMLERAVFELQSRGHKILLAHPERSPGLQRRPELVERLVERGVLTQVTAGSLHGRFGSHVKRFTLRLIRTGAAHVVASDAHDADKRGPALAEAFEAAAGDLPGLREQLEWMTELAPRAILEGGPLPERPALAAGRGRGLRALVRGRRR
jgi:protein-tyrosine phosphatase